jgi:hypothetical protein
MDWEDNIWDLVGLLDQDIALAQRRLDDEDTQPNRRQLVRAEITSLEVLLDFFRMDTAEVILARARAGASLNVHELTPLMDEAAQIGSDGRPNLLPQRIPLKNILAFVVRTHAEHKGLGSTSFLSDNGWAELRKAIRVRHRLTHPKSPDDLDVSVEDLKAVRTGVSWFNRTVRDLVNAPSKPVPTPDWFPERSS